jgi:hypothetical protein
LLSCTHQHREPHIAIFERESDQRGHQKRSPKRSPYPTTTRCTLFFNPSARLCAYAACTLICLTLLFGNGTNRCCCGCAAPPASPPPLFALPPLLLALLLLAHPVSPPPASPLLVSSVTLAPDGDETVFAGGAYSVWTQFTVSTGKRSVNFCRKRAPYHAVLRQNIRRQTVRG